MFNLRQQTCQSTRVCWQTCFVWPNPKHWSLDFWSRIFQGWKFQETYFIQKQHLKCSPWIMIIVPCELQIILCLWKCVGFVWKWIRFPWPQGASWWWQNYKSWTMSWHRTTQPAPRLDVFCIELQYNNGHQHLDCICSTGQCCIQYYTVHCTV